MSSLAAEGIVLEAGKSPELAAAFQIVADAEVGGASKFSAPVCRQLARLVTCRSYAPALLELCHLVTVAAECGRRPRSYEAFFWDGGPARAAVFRGRIARAPSLPAAHPRLVTAGPAGVEIAYPDGRFGINYSRMPLLSALMEFLITVLGYAALDDVLQDMLAEGPSVAGVSGAATRLSKALYAYLKHHLPTAQSHRKVMRLIHYLGRRQGGDFDLSAIDDEAVLEFWLSESVKKPSQGLDFKTFLSVFQSFARLRQALDEACDLRALQHPRPIGPDVAAGEVDPSSVLRRVEAVDEPVDALARLRDGPAEAVKFLTRREAADLELLVRYGTAGLVLALSVMRGELFGAGQTRISQALRRMPRRGDLRTTIGHCVTEDYRDRRDRLAELRAHLDRVLLASLYTLVRARRPEALTIAMALRPDIDLRPLRRVLVAAADSPEVVPLTGDAFTERLMTALQSPDIAGPDFAALVADARQALKGLARSGFREEQTKQAEVVEGLAAGVEPLLGLRRQLAAFCDRLSALPLPKGDWDRQFCADRQTFLAQFLLIYGVQHDRYVEDLDGTTTRNRHADLRGALRA